MPKRLTSLLLVEERLFEADYFADRMPQSDPTVFQYQLNAWLSACRAVTNLVEIELKPRAPGFRTWWKEKFATFLEDESATFFVNLRNYSFHEGKVSIVGGAVRSESGLGWAYRFAATADPVPKALWERDVVDCCREHIARLAQLVLDCVERFPFHACPRVGLSSLAGLKALGLELDELDALVGLPRGWTNVGSDLPDDQRLALLADRVDALDIPKIQELAQYAPDISRRGDLLLNRIAARIDARARGNTDEVGDPVLTSIFERISEIERNRKS